MRIRRLTLFPLLYAVVFVGVALWLSGGDALRPFVRGQLILVRLLAIAGCFAAVSAFERGDHLRRAWLLLGVSTILVLARDLLRLPPFALPGSGVSAGALVVSGLGVLSNVGLLAGIWLLARAWRVAAISLPVGRGGVVGVTLVAAVLALLVAGPSALQHAREVAAGDLSALILLVSAVVDILSLLLLAPLFLTTLALRGGLFAWPWGLVTASVLAWLLYDGAAAVAPSLAPGGFPLPDVFRGLAENFVFVAGLAQKRAVDQVRRTA